MVSRRMPVSRSIRRSDHPRRPNAIACCFFSSLKTLLTLTEDSVLTSAFNVLDDGLQLAGFQVTPTGRFWVTPEGRATNSTNLARAVAHSASVSMRPARKFKLGTRCMLQAPCIRRVEFLHVFGFAELRSIHLPLLGDMSARGPGVSPKK